MLLVNSLKLVKSQTLTKSHSEIALENWPQSQVFRVLLNNEFCTTSQLRFMHPQSPNKSFPLCERMFTLVMQQLGLGPSMTRKKMPNVNISCPKMISLEK